MRSFDIMKNMRSKHCAADGNPKLGGKTLLRQLVWCAVFPLCTVFSLTSHFVPSFSKTGDQYPPVWVTFTSSSFANLVDGVLFRF
jgi:hypothetical protein